MTINELLHQLRKARPTFEVYFDFCHCVPTTVDSWRGIYAEPALGWAATGYSGKGKAPTVATLITELEKAIDGDTYGGWKGGVFTYSGNEALHIDNRGDATNTELAHVEILDYSVILHTRYEP